MDNVAPAEMRGIIRVVFALFAKLFPFRAPPGKEHVTLADLKPQFSRWEIPVVLLLFVCAPFTVWGSKLLLAAIFPPPAAPAGGVFQITIDPMFMILPALFLGLILAAAPVMGVMKLIFGKRFSDYLLYGNLLVGFDTVKIWAALSGVLAAGAVALAAAAAPVHLSIFSDHIELRHMGYSGASAYPFSKIASVATSADGRVDLAFADGTSWSSADDWSLLTISAEQAQYLSAHVKSPGR